MAYMRPYEGTLANGCLNCPDKHRLLPLDYQPLVGFGQITVTRDDKPVWFNCGQDHEMRVADFEGMAQQYPGDWRIQIDGPLSDELYQRQPEGWVLVARGQGFA